MKPMTIVGIILIALGIVALVYQGFSKTPDRLNVAQFRRDGFTFNRLRPYTKWEEIRPEALRLWQLYTAKAKR